MSVKLTDNMKFLLGFVVYIAYASWWASGISTGVAANARHSAETISILKEHMAECSEMHTAVASMQQNIKNNTEHIRFIETILFVPTKEE